MANWEFKNDSTTNYLRAQDQTAQKPIDFYEDGTLDAPAVETGERPNDGGKIKVKDGRGVKYFDIDEKGNFYDTYNYIRDDYLLDQSGRDNVGVIELPAETKLPISGTTLNLIRNTDPGYSDVTIRGSSGSADGSSRLPRGRFVFTNLSNNMNGLRVRDISTQYTIEGLTVDLQNGGGGAGTAGIRVDLIEDNQSIHNIGVNESNGQGIYHHGGRGVHCTKYMIEGCNKAGVKIQDMENSSFFQAEIEKTTDGSGGGSGVLVVNSNGITIRDYIVEQSGDHGAEVDGSNQITIENSEFATASNGACSFTNGSTGVTLRDSFTGGTADKGVVIEGATDVSVVGNRMNHSSEHIRITDSVSNKRIKIVGNQYNGSGTNVSIKGPSPVDIYVDDPTVNGEQAAAPSSSTYTLSFDTAFSHYPRIPITADAEVQTFTNWTTDANGNYTGVDVTFSTTPSRVSWEAVPRNLGN